MCVCVCVREREREGERKRERERETERYTALHRMEDFQSSTLSCLHPSNHTCIHN